MRKIYSRMEDGKEEKVQHEHVLQMKCQSAMKISINESHLGHNWHRAFNKCWNRCKLLHFSSLSFSLERELVFISSPSQPTYPIVLNIQKKSLEALCVPAGLTKVSLRLLHHNFFFLFYCSLFFFLLETDFPGMCFASTRCATVEPGKTWELAPFCGRSTCVLSEDQPPKYVSLFSRF